MGRVKVIIILSILVLLSSLLFLKIYKRPTFPAAVTVCNGAETNLRFSCYRAVIEKYYKVNISGFAQEIKINHSLSFEAMYGQSGKISYAIFGTNCHTFYHAAGDFIATYSNDPLQELLDYGPTACTNGYAMGVYKRLALKNHFSEDLLKEFYRVCKKGAENQCAHEIGHVLHDKYSYSILKILDDITTSKYNISYPQKYDYVTFSEGYIKADLDKPFEECKKLMPDNNKLAQCFTGVGHNLFLYSEFSKDGYKSMFSECSKVSAKNKSNCYGFLVFRIGINEGATRFLSHDFEKGKKVCDDVVDLSGRLDLKEHCYKGIGGGIGLFVDSEYALTEINEKNLVSVKSQLLEYLKLCENSEKEFVNSCFAGLFGTKFAKFYDLLRIYYERIEQLRPSWDNDFEVVG
jgi:hypothetical protein